MLVGGVHCGYEVGYRIDKVSNGVDEDLSCHGGFSRVVCWVRWFSKAVKSTSTMLAVESGFEE